MIFSDSPSQKALERMMTQVKGFPPRGSGVMVLRRFEYTAEMCDCRLCLYYNRKKKCTVSQPVCEGNPHLGEQRESRLVRLPSFSRSLSEDRRYRERLYFHVPGGRHGNDLITPLERTVKTYV